MRRTLSALSSIRVQDHGRAQLVTLSREKALNALDLPMVEMLLPHYRAWHEQPPQSRVVVLKGAGVKAFCAGGDVVSLVKDTPRGIRNAFFYREYQLDHAIASLPHAHVALWDGIVMGGGVGVSVHGSHRICTEAALFAMPETGIGLFPDVGGSWVLPRLPHAGLGMYLALTGARLKGADVVHAGLGTHFVSRADVSKLEAGLREVDPANVDATISAFATAQPAQPFSLAEHLAAIERCFGPAVSSVPEVLERLAAEGSDFAGKTAATMAKMSPLAMAVSFEAQRRGAKLSSLKEVFTMEYRVAQHAAAGGDFRSGVTALLIDKTGKPQWQHAGPSDVPAEAVEMHFARGAMEWHPTNPYPGVEEIFAAAL